MIINRATTRPSRLIIRVRLLDKYAATFVGSIDLDTMTLIIHFSLC
jgi:hypothetical protein